MSAEAEELTPFESFLFARTKPQYDPESKTWFVIENGGDWVTVPAPVDAPWYDEVERMHFKLLDGEVASCQEDGSGGYRLRSTPVGYDKRYYNAHQKSDVTIPWIPDLDVKDCGFDVDAIRARRPQA